MCIPPVNEAPAPHFALTAKIAARNGLKNLSMGMSADFATAIQFGATHVRVGSADFRASLACRLGLVGTTVNAKSTDTFPSAPKSTAQKSPACIGNGGWQVPVVTTGRPSTSRRAGAIQLASQVSASRGSPSTFLPWPMNCWAAQRGHGPLLPNQIARAPIRRRGRTQHETECAQALSAISCAAPAPTEIGESRSGISIAGCSDRRTVSSTCLHGVGRRSRRQIGSHAKREFRLGHAHFVAGHRRRPASAITVSAGCAGHRAVDIDVFLSGRAGGRDLPAEQVRGSNIVRSRPGSHILRCGPTVAASRRAHQAGAGEPMVVQASARQTQSDFCRA